MKTQRFTVIAFSSSAWLATTPWHHKIDYLRPGLGLCLCMMVTYLHYSRDIAVLHRADFKKNRLNGDEKKDAVGRDWERNRVPAENSITWTKGEKKSEGCVYGVKEPDGYYHYECRYDADEKDLEWMRKTDCNYLKRILTAGRLKKLEPDVYYLCLISGMRCIGDEIAKDFDIGRWWRTQVDKPNIADLLQSAQTVYEARRVLEAKCEMFPDLSKIIGEYVTVAPADKKEEKEMPVDPKPSSCSMM